MNHEISWIFQLYNMQNLSGSPDGFFISLALSGLVEKDFRWSSSTACRMNRSGAHGDAVNMFNHLHPLLIAAQSPLLKRLNVWTGCVGTGIALAWGSGKYPTCSYSTTEHEPTRYPVSCNPYALLRVITCWPSVQDWNHENQRTSNRHEQERILRN